MDIKMMHEMIEKLTECAKSEMDKKGIEEIDTEEFGKATDIIKDLAEAMYYRTLTEAMKESEYGEDYDEYGAYDDGRRGYRGQPRDSRGRYMSRRGRGGRRGYEEPWDEMYDEMEYYRDMDRPSMNRMYYSGSGSNSGMSGQSSSGSGMSGGNMGGSEGNRGGGNSRYENARRGYEEKKTIGADKAEKMKGLEEYMKELSTDVSSMLTDMTPEEKTLMKQKMSVLMSKIQ